MNISLYKKWVEEFRCENLSFKSLQSFEDIVFLTFKENGRKMHIYLGNEENLLFMTPPPSVESGFLSTRSGGTQGDGIYTIMSNHLNHSILKNCQIINNDKIIEFHFTKWNIYNQIEDLFLTIELIPKYQNIILNRGQDRIILDCKKKISFAENQTRQILPGAIYSPPKTSFVHSEEPILLPFEISPNEFCTI